MKKNTTLDADLAGYSATATSTLAKKARRQTLKRVVGFGAATSVGLLTGTGLEAAIIYSGLQNIVLNPGPGNGHSAYSFDMDGGGTDFVLIQRNSQVGANDSFTKGSAYILGLNGGLISATNASQSGRRLSSGQTVGTIDSRLNYGPYTAFLGYTSAAKSGQTTHTFGNFPVSQAGFVGVQLGSGDFGWIQIHRQFQQLEIIDWAYDDSGAHIRAGAVPEPALLGLGLLSLGAAGVRELRRRKREAAAVSDSTPTA